MIKRSMIKIDELYRNPRAISRRSGYVAMVPALPGSVSQGKTHAEAMANIREAVELYIEDCLAAGDPVPNEAGKEFVELQVPS
jgi:predicted RNase H-like HicB family nuclease